MKKETEKQVEKKAEKPKEAPKEVPKEVKKEEPKQPLEKVASKTEEKKEEKKITIKKWKGKEWYNVIAPKMFNNKKIAETPCTDPKSLENRVIKVALSELIGNPTKNQIKIQFKVKKIEDKNVLTEFDGYTVLKESLMRSIRKGSQKVTLIQYYNTNDGWKLQITTTVIMNRNTDTNLKKKVRHLIDKKLSEAASNSTLNDFIKQLITSNIQRSIKKEGNKIYPVRFSEIEKVEVIKTGK